MRDSAVNTFINKGLIKNMQFTLPKEKYILTFFTPNLKTHFNILNYQFYIVLLYFYLWIQAGTDKTIHLRTEFGGTF